MDATDDQPEEQVRFTEPVDVLAALDARGGLDPLLAA